MTVEVLVVVCLVPILLDSIGERQGGITQADTSRVSRSLRDRVKQV